MKLSLFCHDLSSNAFGRTYLLAEVLQRRHEVEVLGPTFGDGIWAPCADAPFPIRAFPGGRWLAFAATAWRIARAANGELLYAVKAMPSSLGIALLARSMGPRRPLLLDVDDWELAFQLAEEERLGMARWLRTVKAVVPTLRVNSKALVSLMERLACRADASTTVSEFLELRYRLDALLVPHARDTAVIDPALFPQCEAKRRLGLEGRFVAMFLGNARRHKGVEDLVLAVESLGKPEVLAVLVGTPPSEPFMAEILERWAERVRVFGQVPFREMPAWLAAADVVVLPQRHDPRAQGQVPAKLSDALALGKPVIVTDTAGMPALVGDAGLVVPPGDVPAIARALEELVTQAERRQAMAAAARRRALSVLSYDAAAETLERALRKAFDAAGVAFPGEAGSSLGCGGGSGR